MEGGKTVKAVFLDFDGVISTYEKGWTIDPGKLVLLKEITDSSGAVIVVTSTWKIGYRDARSFSRAIAGKADGGDGIMRWFASSIYSITDNRGGSRGEQVARWLKAAGDDTEGYVILDDDSDYLDCQLFNLVQTDTYEGLTMREVKLCMKILSGERVVNPVRLNGVLYSRWRNRCDGLPSGNVGGLLEEYYSRFS